MPSPRIQRLATYGLLAVAAVLVYALPAREIAPASSTAAPAPPAAGVPRDRVRLSGVVRDFSREHVDFDVAPVPDAVGHYEGAVAARLDDHGLPVFASIPLRVETQWRDASDRPIPARLADADVDPCGAAWTDRSGARGPAGGTITSAESFSEWFRDTLGANMSTGSAIDLERDDDGVFSFVDTEFFPVDHRLFGDEGLEHNHFFTFVVEATFEYDACEGQFLELAGGDGLYVFVNGRLAVDLGGVLPPTSQYLELDRLGLEDGSSCRLKLFYAQRNPVVSSLAIRTNVALRSTNPVASVINGFD